MELKGYIPIEVKGNRDYLWYLSVLDLDLCNLLQLRKELEWYGAGSNSIRVLDGYINMVHNVYVNNEHYYDNDGFGYKREYKKEKKTKKFKMKKKSKERNSRYVKY